MQPTVHVSSLINRQFQWIEMAVDVLLLPPFDSVLLADKSW